MEILTISLNAVLPLLIIIVVGYALKRWRIVTNRGVKQLNRAVFFIFIPLLLFNNIYKTELEEVIQPRLIIFAVASVIVIWCISVLISVFTEKSPSTRGAMIQGMYRSNFTLYGLPVVTLLFGGSNTGVASFLIAVIVPMFNLMSIVTLEFFRGGKINFKRVIFDIIKNPLTIGSLLGVLALLLNIALPVFIETSINTLSALAVPLSLIVMGASFTLMTVYDKRWKMTLTVVMKLVIFPAVFLAISILLGFRDIELASLMALFASPTAIASYPMAVQMNSDKDFACGVVVFSTLFSIITVFSGIFLLQYFSFISVAR